MQGTLQAFDIDAMLLSQWMVNHLPPAGLLEARVMELERMGMLDEEELPGVPSSARQFAIASLSHDKPYFFITVDDQMLLHREHLEDLYHINILSISEAILLLRDSDGPIN